MSAIASRQPSVMKQVGMQILLFSLTMAVLYPALWVLKMALTPENLMQNSGPWPLPDPNAMTLDNFMVVITHGCESITGSPDIGFSDCMNGEKPWLFARQLWNSLLIAGVTSVIGIVLSCTAGYAMSRFTFPGRESSMNFFLVTQMFPGVVMAIPLYLLMEHLGLLNSAFGLALVYAATAVPFCTWNLKGYFDTIPTDLEEAARMDGASQWVIFTQIVLPLSKPALAVTALFSFMTAWNEFILAATFISDEKAYTLPVLLNSYLGEYDADYGYFAAGALIASAPVMALFFALQRHLVEGLTAGSVKG